MTLPAFRAVVMDMDGLALDTEETYCHAWRAAAADAGIELSPDYVRSLFGRHADDVKQALLEACGSRLDFGLFIASAERYWYSHLETHGVATMPGLRRLLSLFREQEVPYALATNSDAPYATQLLRRAGVIDQFPVRVTRDQVARGKPEPDLFLEAARRLGVPPSDCLGLEDSETGLRACISAGMSPVLIPNRALLSTLAVPEGVILLTGLDTLADYLANRAV
jgi:beta-phosphoglucomutase